MELVRRSRQRTWRQDQALCVHVYALQGRLGGPYTDLHGRTRKCRDLVCSAATVSLWAAPVCTGDKTMSSMTTPAPSADDGVCMYVLSMCRTSKSGYLPLAHQRKPQITRYFTTQTLHYHKLKPDSEDYKQEQAKVFYLPSLTVVLKGLRVAERVHFGFQAHRGLISQYF